MIQRVVIFGGHIQALGLARQVAAHRRGLVIGNRKLVIGEQEPKIEVVIVTDDGCSVARFSRAVDRTIIEPIGNWSLVIGDLELPEKGTMLFPTNDEAVEMLCGRYDQYKERFALGEPSPEVIELFNNKRTAYRYATTHKVPCPECWYPNTLAEVETLSSSLPYPVVVKPAIMYSFHATFGKKAFRCDNAEELKNIYQRIADADYPLESILIQEFLSGGPKHLYSYGVMAADGKPLVSIQANRIRQNPMDFGNSTTFAVTCDIPAIETLSGSLLAETKYFGLGEVEWMWDEKAQQYKFLEINTRAWKWHTISNQLGFSFIGAMIDWFDGVSQKYPTMNPKDKVAWVERLTDWTVIAKEILHGRMTLKEVCASYKIKHESAVWSWRDPLPAIMYILLSPILYVKRH